MSTEAKYIDEKGLAKVFSLLKTEHDKKTNLMFQQNRDNLIYWFGTKTVTKGDSVELQINVNPLTNVDEIIKYDIVNNAVCIINSKVSEARLVKLSDKAYTLVTPELDVLIDLTLCLVGVQNKTNTPLTLTDFVIKTSVYVLDGGEF